MLTIPADFLQRLQLNAGARVEINIDRGRLVIESKPAPRYTLEELIARTDHAAWAALKDDSFIASPPVGKELI